MLRPCLDLDSYLQDHLECCPASGRLFAKKTFGKYVVGQEVGRPNHLGYVIVYVPAPFALTMLGHRLVWFLHYGHWPRELDHIDRNRGRNCIANLREATRSQNMSNRSGWSKLGLPKGVRYRRGRYDAQITINRRKVTLGSFKTPEEAHKRYLAKAREVMGEFASA
jgi:hypothetical protein